MQARQLPEFITELLKPRSYDHPVGTVQLIQTHISSVLLAGDYAYKFKKPVDLGFLNFTTLAKRAHYCEQELDLNRRLCPDIYLDVVTVTRSGNRYEIDGAGEIVEYGVKMKRLPEEKMMGRIIATGELRKNHLDGIVEKLVPFYQLAESGDLIASYGTAKSVGVNVLENHAQTAPFVDGPVLSREQFELVGAYTRKVLSDKKRFRSRIAKGHIRDCHGDLHSGNICLAEEVHIFDCIEFNARFRYCDVAADIGFLAMDLDYHGCDKLSEYFLTRFAEISGDKGMGEHIGFYKCYRAWVRGKIGLFTAADSTVDRRIAAQCVEQSRRYFQLAEHYARNHF